MKPLFSIIFLIILHFISCDKVEIKTSAPLCIDEKINSWKKSDLPCESGKSVFRYKFNDRFVYVFDPGDCGADMMADVYDEECNRICGLGGIAGNLMCEGVNFWEVATDETKIWED